MIYVLTGPVHSRKTTLLTQISDSLREKGFNIDGFLSVSTWRGGERTGYLLYDLSENKRHPFVSTTGDASWQKIGPYYFIPEGIERAKRILLRSRNVDFLIVDEVGPLELSGKGLWPVLADLLSDAGTDCILVVREGIVGDFLSMLKGSETKIFHVHEEDVFARIMQKLTAKGTKKGAKDGDEKRRQK